MSSSPVVFFNPTVLVIPFIDISIGIFPSNPLGLPLHSNRVGKARQVPWWRKVRPSLTLLFLQEQIESYRANLASVIA